MTEKRLDIMAQSAAEDLKVEGNPPWLKDRLEWFQDQKFGLMMHWGLYGLWGCIESWPLVEEDTWARPEGLKAWVERGKDIKRFQTDYWNLNRVFNPGKFAPEKWADAAKYAGMKYVAFTTKHHDGFCLFDTKTTDYRVTHPSCPFHSNPRSNIVREVFNAFRARDFGISCYFSKSDWHVPYYWIPDAPARTRHPNYDTHTRPEIWAKFKIFVHQQVEELMTGYGRIDVLWLDGGQVRPPDQDIDMPRMAAMARRHQPGLIIADRTVGGCYENILTPEQTVPDTPLGHTWESCMTMAENWGFSPNDKYKSARTLLHMLIDVAAKDGNLLLNVGPTPDGEFPPEATDRLKAIGDWMAINAEAIHGTRACKPYKDGNICFTQKGEWMYAIILAEENESRPKGKARIPGFVPAAGKPVELLGVHSPLVWEKVGDGIEVSLPEGCLPCDHAWVLKILPRER